MPKRTDIKSILIIGAGLLCAEVNPVFAASHPSIDTATAPCLSARQLLWNYLADGRKPDGAKAEAMNQDMDGLASLVPDCALAIYADKDTPQELKGYMLQHAKEMQSCKGFDWCSAGGEYDRCGSGHEPDYCTIYKTFLPRLEAIHHAQTH